MNCQRVQDSLIDHLEGLLSSAEASAVDEHLGSCAACARERERLARTLASLDALPAEEPSPRLRANFLAMLDDRIANEDEPARRAGFAAEIAAGLRQLFTWRTAMQGAFSVALVAVGITIGLRFAARPPAPVASAETPATHQELAELKSKVDSMSQLVAYSLARQQPDNVRLRAIASDLQNKNVDAKTLADLVGTLAFDPSTNVRLSALEALYAHADQPIAREGVLASLPREKSPLVQLAMIDFLAAVRERKAAPALESMTRDSTIDKEVRAAARLALARL